MSEKFRTKKQGILGSLSTPNEDYTDASPKGSIDDGVRDLLALINNTQNFVPPPNYEIRWDAEKVAQFMSTWEERGYLTLKPEKLKNLCKGIRAIAKQDEPIRKVSLLWHMLFLRCECI